MPKQVFFKISKDRREKLLKPAIKEFAKKTYNKVTVLSLTKTMKILRTDFYYYFQDKEDIYGEILNCFFNYVQSVKEDADLNDALVILFDKAASLKGLKNRQYLADISENFNPQFANELSLRLIEKYGEGCNPDKAVVKTKIKIYKFMAVLNEYIKGALSKELAVEILEHKHCQH